MKAAPVTIIKPDGSSHVTSAWDLRHRPAAAADSPEDSPPSAEDFKPGDAVTQESLEAMVMQTLYKVMRDSDKLSERTAAATSAVKFLGIKWRVGPAFGEDLDE